MARMVVVLMVAVSCGLFDTPQRTRLDELIQNVPFGGDSSNNSVGAEAFVGHADRLV